MKLTTYLLAAAALIAVSLNPVQAQTTTQNQNSQNQRFSIGGYEVRPLIGIEFDESGIPIERRPQRRGPTLNSAPASRPTNPAVTTPQTVVTRPRPQQGTGVPQARPANNSRPQAGNGAPAARPSMQPRPQAGNGAPVARPSNQPRPQTGAGAPGQRGPIVRDHRQPNAEPQTSVTPDSQTPQRQVRDHRDYQNRSLSERRRMNRFK